jgi:hypothetical protein
MFGACEANLADQLALGSLSGGGRTWQKAEGLFRVGTAEAKGCEPRGLSSSRYPGSVCQHEGSCCT